MRFLLQIKNDSIKRRQYNNQDFEDVAYFEPFYLKDFVAGVPKVKGLK